MCFKGFLFDIKKKFHYFRLNNFEDIMILIAVFKTKGAHKKNLHS